MTTMKIVMKICDEDDDEDDYNDDNDDDDDHDHNYDDDAKLYQWVQIDASRFAPNICSPNNICGPSQVQGSAFLTKRLWHTAHTNISWNPCRNRRQDPQLS